MVYVICNAVSFENSVVNEADDTVCSVYSSVHAINHIADGANDIVHDVPSVVYEADDMIFFVRNVENFVDDLGK